MSRCDDCGVQEGAIHHPECSIWADVLVSNDANLTFRDERPINLSFMDDNGVPIGEFKFDKENRRWTFSGNMDEAAKQFAKFMYAHFQSILQGDRDNILHTPIYVDPVEEPDHRHEPQRFFTNDRHFDPYRRR